MWLFGQVWFACLVGFVVGVGLTWLWGVRPANKRAADAELSARRAERPIQQASRPADYRADDLRPGFGNTSYDAGSVGDTAAPSSVGVSTGSGRPGLDEMFEPERAEQTHVDTTRAHSVDDYVEALVQEYQGDAPVPNQSWSNRSPEAVESWRPGALGARLDAGDPPNTPSAPDQQDERRGGSFDSQLTSYQPVQQQYPDPEPQQQPEEATMLQPRPFANNYGAGGEFGSRGNADEQYLDYLRSGAMDSGAEHPVVPQPEPEPEPEAVRDYVAQEPEPEYPAHQQYSAEQYPAEQPYQADQYQPDQHYQPEQQHADQYQSEQYTEGQQYTEGNQYPAEDYPAQQYPEYPAQDQYPAEHHAVADDESEQDYEQQEYEQVEDKPSPPPAHSSEQAAEVTSVLPLVQDDPVDEVQEESPAEQTVVDQEPVAEQEDEHAVPAQRDYFEPEPLAGLVRPHSHDGGPIASAQPFQLDGPDRVDSGAQQGQLTPIEEGGWQPFAKPFGEEEEAEPQQQWQDDWSEDAAPVNGTHVEADQYETDEQRDPTGPVAAEIIQQADHAGAAAPAEATSVFAPVLEPEDYDEDWEEHADPASSRSLFEPVIEPEQPTGYLAPVAPPVPQNDQQPVRQATAPHPIRVRTGIAQPNRPVRAPSGSAGWQTGPFGPGSALPLPDGSAPSPQFRIKARTSSMVFHTESSPFYDRLEPQVWFSSQEDAQRAGFTSWERPRTW
ncbi:MAG TPA: hypothetical protein VGN81_16220 [Pseudonocardiaceae bacterium]|jgi:hypothetical protein